MITQAYLENIQQQILKELDQAKRNIVLAVAWLTDQQIFDKLCEKSASGIDVELMIYDDDINNNCFNEFDCFKNFGGKLYKITDQDNNKALINNKFCIIDLSTIIIGSYNWGYKYQEIQETITVVYNAKYLSNQLFYEFIRIKEKKFNNQSIINDFDISKILKRLQIIKTLINLNEKENLPYRLINILYSDRIKDILFDLESQNYDSAFFKSKLLFDQYPQIIPYFDNEINGLKLEAKSYEIQINALSDEKVEIEKLIFNFNFRHTIELGPIIKEILTLRKKTASTEQEKQEADQDKREYTKEYDSHKDIIIYELNNNEIEVLKLTFRAASKLCNLDAISEEDKEMASNISKKLLDAYKKNDLKMTLQILRDLEKGNPFINETEILNIKNHLIIFIKGLKEKFNVLIKYFIKINEFKNILLIRNIKDWDSYFLTQKNLLVETLKQLHFENDKDLLLINSTDLELEKTNFNIAFTNKLNNLVFSSRQNKLIEFLVESSHKVNFTIKVISYNYPLTLDFIDKYKHKWDWYLLNYNQTLVFNIELIERYKDKWTTNVIKKDWHTLSKNSTIVWTKELIEKYKDKWDWDILIENKSFPWTIELIEEYRYLIDLKKLILSKYFPWTKEFVEKYENEIKIWNWNWENLSSNKSILWSLEFIKKYKDYWNWKYLSSNELLPWKTEFIEEYIEKWDWKFLSKNKALPWTEEFIEEYKGKWDWEFLSRNEALPWTVEFFVKYLEQWDWKSLSQNESLPWNRELIEIYKEKWNWDRLSENEALPWTIELIKKYEFKWDWDCLTQNNSLPWGLELFYKYIEKWNWSILCWNELLPWTIGLIEKYKEKWSWEILSKKKTLPWSMEIIDKYKNEWDWVELSSNEAIPWTIELIKKHEDKWEWWSLIDNQGVYDKIIQPHINDKILDEVMIKIINKKFKRTYYNYPFQFS
jgi:hypothetical protein